MPGDSPRWRSSRFRPVKLLGRGSMGVVWRVHDEETGTDVALKTLTATGPENLYRLKGEFRVLAGISHPNLVELYELIVDEDVPFFTMELVDGVDFVTGLRRESSLVAERIGPAAAQLAEGVAALHAAGRLHRDIKPSNVLVTADGRVVLLDFGLATAFGRDAPAHYGSGLTGTFAYMAPEVLLGGAPSAEADWYGVGVLLHEALTGDLPGRGPGDPRVAEIAREAVAPIGGALWGETLATLLDARPERRVDGVARILEASGGSAVARQAARATTRFVGRRAEITVLLRALESTEAGEGRIVHVTGASGIGKSELVRHFLAESEAAANHDRRPVVLSGRCHPQEALPYKALDPLVDRLSRVLLEQPDLAVACFPEDAGSLRRLFPVLDRVSAFAAESASTAEPLETRRQGFIALRALIAALASRTRLVLWIDDLQWSDADSLLLLHEILKPPLPPLLALLSYRGDDAALVERLRTVALPQFTSRIELGPLGDEDSAALLRGFRATVGARSDDAISWSGDTADLSRIMADASGSPFFLCELGRSLAEGRAAPQIGDLVRDRLAGLSEAALYLLELVSVAGGPLPRSLALEASGIGERGRALATGLEKRSLLRTTSLARGVGIEIYHDRIRDSLLSALAGEETRQRHATLADVLASVDEPDPEALFRHSLGAGRREEAGGWAVTAADRAASALAFTRAAELYEQAVELRTDGTAAWPLLEKRAEALANSGRALDAANTYVSAGRELEREKIGDRRAMLHLRERAATHFLQTGHLEEGLTVTRDVLRDVGIRYPRSPAHALMSSMWQRARLAMRGLEFELRPGVLDEARKLRLEACWGAAISLTMVDPAGSDTLGMRHLLESLDSGDPDEILRSIGAEAGRTAQLAGKAMRRRCAKLAGIMEGLVRERGRPFDRAHLHSVHGMIAFQSSLWSKAHEHFLASSEILRRDCFGVSWELATIETFGLSALAHSGRFARLAELLPNAIGDAADRGDVYATLLFHTGVMNQDWLVRDLGDEALAVAEDTMARWPASDRFQVQHYVHLIATVNADLYRGDPWSAFARIERAWPKLRAALFLALESARVELRNLRARSALAAAVSPVLANGATPPNPRWPRKRLLALASKEAAKLRRIGDVVSARPFAALIEAGILAARGEDEAAARAYEDAEARLRGVEMSLHSAAAAMRRAPLLGGSERERLTSKACAWARLEAIRNPDRMFATFAPGGQSTEGR